MAPPPALSLAEVLEEALIWQPEAEECIAACVAPGGKTAGLARRTALVSTAYAGLLEAAQGLAPTPEQQEAVRLLTFHHRLVHEALYFGFRPDSPTRDEVATRFRGGLAGPGQRLADLYEKVSLGPVAEISQLLDDTRSGPDADLSWAPRRSGSGSGAHRAPGPDPGPEADPVPGTDSGGPPHHGRHVEGR